MPTVESSEPRRQARSVSLCLQLSRQVYARQYSEKSERRETLRSESERAGVREACPRSGSSSHSKQGANKLLRDLQISPAAHRVPVQENERQGFVAQRGRAGVAAREAFPLPRQRDCLVLYLTALRRLHSARAYVDVSANT